MISINDFCDKHEACQDGRDWAIANCVDMADAWQRLKPDWLLWVATRPGVLTDRELRLSAVFCARQVQHLLTDQRSRDVIEVAEKFANGAATCNELAAARAAGWDALDAALDAARDAALDASTARAAARAALDAAAARAATAAGNAVWAAAWAAAGDADAAAAWDAAAAAQSDWLRANTTPNFGVEVQS